MVEGGSEVLGEFLAHRLPRAILDLNLDAEQQPRDICDGTFELRHGFLSKLVESGAVTLIVNDDREFEVPAGSKLLKALADVGLHLPAG